MSPVITPIQPRDYLSGGTKHDLVEALPSPHDRWFWLRRPHHDMPDREYHACESERAEIALAARCRRAGVYPSERVWEIVCRAMRRRIRKRNRR